MLFAYICGRILFKIENMTSKIKFTSILLFLVAFGVISCNKEESYEPITLLYDAYGPTFDNQTKLITIPLFGESLPILINGGDGNFSITNNSQSVIDYTFDGQSLIIQAITPGTGSITIKDNSRNSYILQITVFSNEVSDVKVSSYAIVRGVNMDAWRKATLEQKIIADAPTGVLQFRPDVIKIGIPFIARQYLTNAEDSEYKEYTAVLQNGQQQPQGQMPLITEVACWFTMKSDAEEFELYICQPFHLDNGKLIRGYNFISEVTNRYIEEYPEITAAFEVQSYFNQNY